MTDLGDLAVAAIRAELGKARGSGCTVAITTRSGDRAAGKVEALTEGVRDACRSRKLVPAHAPRRASRRLHGGGELVVVAKGIEVRWDDEFTEHYDLDIGDGHYLRWGYKHFEGERPPDERPVSAIIAHVKPDAPHRFCEGAITFEPGYGPPVWQVHSWEPLTLSPSLLCHCGDHGFVRDGRWVRT